MDAPIIRVHMQPHRDIAMDWAISIGTISSLVVGSRRRGTGRETIAIERPVSAIEQPLREFNLKRDERVRQLPKVGWVKVWFPMS